MEKPRRERRGKKQFDFSEQQDAPKTESQQKDLAKLLEANQLAQEQLPVIQISEHNYSETDKKPVQALHLFENKPRLTDTKKLYSDPVKREKFLKTLDGFKLLQDRPWIESSEELLKFVSSYLHSRIGQAKKLQMKVTWLDCCHALLIGPLPDPNPHLHVDTELKSLLNRRAHTETVANERRDNAIALIRKDPTIVAAQQSSYQEMLEVEEHIKENFTIKGYRIAAKIKYPEEIIEYEKEAFKKFFVGKCNFLKKVDRDCPAKSFIPLPCVFRVKTKLTTMEKNMVCCWNYVATAQDKAEHKQLKEEDFVMRKWLSAEVQSQITDQNSVVSSNEHRDLDLLHRLIYGNSMKEKNEYDFYHSTLDRTKNTIIAGDKSKQLFISPDIAIRSKALLKLREELLMERLRTGVTLEEPKEAVDAVELISLEPGVREERKLLAARAKGIPEEHLMVLFKNALNHKARVENLFSPFIEEEQPLEKVTLVDVVMNADYLGKRVLGLKK